jgi:DNA-binding response OmpR family regulator
VPTDDDGDDADAGAEATSERPSIDPPLVSGKHARLGVLVVDDEPLVRRTIARALTRVGMRVLECESVAEARKIMQSDAVLHVILTDISLRDGDGTMLAGEARARVPPLSVIYTSGHAMSELIARGVDPDRDEVLLKPFAPSDLVARVRACIGDGVTQLDRAPRSSGRK